MTSTPIKIETLKTVLVTDCGSTTTKALLFEKTSLGWRQTFRGESPTTVEVPVADVTVGALNSFIEIEELSKRQILKSQGDNSNPFLFSSIENNGGIDLYLSTSSAGGGLQMIVSGIAKDITARAAQRAALGAGAIVLDVLCADDKRGDIEKIDRIRNLKPDIILLTGGIDGGSSQLIIEAAELILAAAPKPRFGATLKLPIIYAGNRDCLPEVEKLLSGFANIVPVSNIQPKIDTENLAPAREAIHELFLSHVMSHSPGYSKLLSWSPQPIMPTPSAVGEIVSGYAKRNNIEVLCADIGGATTDLFSTTREEETLVYNRSVSANLGMSYSIANVLIEAGVENIGRWVPYKISPEEIRDRLRNKMIRPTSIPQTKEDLWLEQAVCREALRLSLKHHKSLLGFSVTSRRRRGIAEIFSQNEESTGLNMMNLDLVIGSGGVLSHAPKRVAAALMMIEGFGLEGVTEIAVDSIFMMPHLGVLSKIHPAAAEEIFLHDCLVRVCHAVVPLYSSRLKGQQVAEIFWNDSKIGVVKNGAVSQIKMNEGEKGILKVVPQSGLVNCGAGFGKHYSKEIILGGEGFILDGRNRPINLPSGEDLRIENFKNIYEELNLS